jgi:DNA (cytosine-5)-methyltransferase 1
MIRDQFILDLQSEIIIDNFAGGGGASTGIELALGRHVDVAINHDPEAVALHTANHPQTRHYCENVWAVDPRDVMPGRQIGLLWLSPDCKHFSKAKGGKPVEKKIRGLAWVALRWAAIRKPRVIMLENVEEFTTWGPLIKDQDGDMRPDPEQKGRTFRSFVNALVSHGYTVDWRELRACDYGAPTIRKRLFLIARRDGKPIVWPSPTHCDPESALVKSKALKPWRTAADCIDWTIPCPSIFERSKPLADATCRRIAKGIMRYVINSAEPFIVKYYGEKNKGEFRGSGINVPLHTQSTENRFALCAPVLTEHANASSPRCMPADEPLRTICAQTKGGHHALVSAFLAKHYTGVVGADMRDPTPTVTSVDHNSLVSANLIHLGHGEGKNGNKRFSHGIRDARQPINTITASGGNSALVQAFLIKYYSTDQDPNLREPLHTVTTKDRYGLVTIAGTDYSIADIGLRMLSPRELYRAQGFPETYIIDRGQFGREWHPITKTAQVRMCGNSVCPPLASALVKANVPEMAAWSRREIKQLEAA